MAVSEQSKKEKAQKQTLVVLSVILAISVFLNIYQLFYIKQIENSEEFIMANENAMSEELLEVLNRCSFSLHELDLHFS